MPQNRGTYFENHPLIMSKCVDKTTSGAFSCRFVLVLLMYLIASLFGGLDTVPPEFICTQNMTLFRNRIFVYVTK